MANHSRTTGTHTLGTPAHRPGTFNSSNDAYRSDHKLPDTTACRVCHASVHDGRWQWLEAKTGAREVVCPACQRIEDELPAGMVSIEGAFFAAHRVDLLNLIQKHAKRAWAMHPLRRLMNVADTPEGVLVTTTDTHLARELGQALHDAYDGEVSYGPADGQELLRVHWKR